MQFDKLPWNLSQSISIWGFVRCVYVHSVYVQRVHPKTKARGCFDSAVDTPQVPNAIKKNNPGESIILYYATFDSGFKILPQKTKPCLHYCAKLSRSAYFCINFVQEIEFCNSGQTQ